MMKKWVIWLLSVIGIELTGVISSLFAGDIGAMYQAMDKPPFSPPGSVFGIMWTILYAMMGTALFLLIVAEDTKYKKIAIVLFGLQQILNFSWSIIFFGGNNLGIASTVIVALDLLILASIWAFAKVNRWASYLFVPYLIWCLYATYLCIGFAILN